MSVIFHDGTNNLYKGYVGNKTWDDLSLLRLDWDTSTNRKLREWNTETNIGILLDAAKSHKLSGYVSSLKSYMEADEDTASIIVIKGVHQPFGDQGKWVPHISIGLDGYIWHLYYTWHRNDTMSFDGSSRGPRATGSTHDGWKIK